MAITRVTWTDDSGGGDDGTILNNANLQSIFDAIELNWLWDAVAHNDANFTGDGTDGNWVVASGDHDNFKYRRHGKKIEFKVTIVTSSVANTPAILTIAIPGGFTALNSDGGTFWYSDNGTSGLGRWYVQTSGTVINLVKTSGNWTNATNTTAIQVQGHFEIS